MQDLCREKRGWDDELSDEQRSAWLKWRYDLPLLENIEIDRCFKTDSFSDCNDVSLHHFSDASKGGYGEVSYLRFVNKDDRIHTALVMGKSRVTPLKEVSIPRLELTAAVLSVKVSSMLRKELDMVDLQEYFWTDSQVVLAYLKNESKRFHTYVANRIQLIRDHSAIDRWFYVKTDENPADDTSRGLSARNIEKSDRWFNGPEFLRSPLNIHEIESSFEIPIDDVEVKKEKMKVAVVSYCEENDLLARLEERCSSWQKMLNVVTVMLRWKYRENAVNVADVKRAEIALIKLIQQRAFGDELKTLPSFELAGDARATKMKRKRMTKSCNLFRLDPFVDKDGVVRVGGRLRNSAEDFEIKHPTILPRRCSTTKLIILHFHSKVEHQGRGLTLNAIRSAGFWIINGNSQARFLIDKCVRCRYLRGKLLTQKMADLPADRLEDVPPFTYCAVDLFGPFLVKNGRKLCKRYGTLFTCLSCRAVHLESVNSLDADSFILALRRLIARRGRIRMMRSDNGTNFVGADRELRDAIREMDQEKVKEFLLTQKCDYIFEWKRNPPTASHMGGVWERQIRSVRCILDNILKTHGESLNDESFSTFLAEAECIVNSRPLSVETLNDVESPLPLSPNNILQMKSEYVLPPPGSFSRDDLYCRRRWRRVQHLLNEFWFRWKREYLSSLQQRKKWNVRTRLLQPGDVVLVSDSNSVRGTWPLGLVTETLPGDDGLVRKVKLRMNGDVFERPVQKLVLLLESERGIPRQGASHV